MEGEAGLEAEVEDVTREIGEAEQSFTAAERSLSEMAAAELEMSADQNLWVLQEERGAVADRLDREKEKLSQLEETLRQLLVRGGGGDRSSEDSGTQVQQLVQCAFCEFQHKY